MAGREMPFEKLDIWQKARELTAEIYQNSSDGEFARDYGLKDQIRRAAVSVMSNIAEGWDRKSQADRSRFLTIAKASASELRSQLYVALDCEYIDQSDFEILARKAIEVSKMISGLQRAITRSS